LERAATPTLVYAETEWHPRDFVTCDDLERRHKELIAHNGDPD
jgi:hypothetical protein